jgi:hypothetical protein
MCRMWVHESQRLPAALVVPSPTTLPTRSCAACRPSRVTAAESQDKAECLIGQQHEQERVIRVKKAEVEEAQCQLAVWQATVSLNGVVAEKWAGLARDWGLQGPHGPCCLGMSTAARGAAFRRFSPRKLLLSLDAQSACRHLSWPPPSSI